VRAFNHTPRLCLDFRTPAEVFYEQVLHFERESISRLPPG
jgi:IS30 family transposase